ncbi:sterol desaturase family protein [Fulvivirgaceae bacterium BMA12]|uniref:Sterol desaturase family protein n=1 Tax=Agaribacillus aureus TaxID=3051825 RepID=A0ABT8L2C1_9BACT|nr:sterol desaturase family protein [Fulvivirgaceae bacterium BMA12]
MIPVSLDIYLSISLVNNVGEHVGFEIIPKKVMDNPILKYTNVVTFHDLHHTDFHVNFGAYFNIWDRVMRTMHKDLKPTFTKIHDR